MTRIVAALGAGVAVALSLPPWGWWPLGWLGMAALLLVVGDLPTRARGLLGAAFGVGYFTVGLWWMGEFHALGAAAVVAGETAFVAVAVAVTPPGRWRWMALPGAVVLAEALRSAVPFGGVPIAGAALGQVGGPLAGVARMGGGLALLGLAAVAGSALGQLLARRWLGAGMALVVVMSGAGLGALAPDGGEGPSLSTAVVQGGGRRGYRGVESDPAVAFRAHTEASQAVSAPVGLVLWPEDVIDVEGPVASAPEGGEVAGIARRLGATLVAGAIEGEGDRFRNAAVAWGPDGGVVGRYDKVKRVPFGEYIPFRALFDSVVDLSAVPRDAKRGRGTGFLRAPAGDLGVSISFEVFFSSRTRAATRAGAELIVIPTNASSYSTTQVPTQEIAAARLRAIESGRDLLQAAPTGYSAHVDNRGRVLARTSLGRRQVLQQEVGIRSGRTWYTTVGDAPVLGISALVLIAGWLLHRRRSRDVVY